MAAKAAIKHELCNYFLTKEETTFYNLYVENLAYKSEVVLDLHFQ